MSPRRTAVDLGVGSEAWRMKPRALHSGWDKIRKDVQAKRLLTGMDDTGMVARKLAGTRAEARFGYSVDNLHEWGTRGRHTMYMTPAGTRLAVSTEMYPFPSAATPCC